jgi:LacI family transcriptional regulator
LDHLWALSQQKKPFVSIEEVPGIKGNYVTFDEERAGFLAAEHLIRQGHRRICCLRGPDSASSAEARLTGFKDALLTYNVKFDGSMIAPAGHRPEDGYRAARKILTGKASAEGGPEPFTAMICFSDFVAIGVYQAAHELNVRIPERLSVVGFDDIEISELLAPSLTTVRLPIATMGQRLAEILLEAIRLKNKQAEPVHELLEPTLIERQSVKQLNNQT